MKCKICNKDLIKDDKVIIIGEWKITSEKTVEFIRDKGLFCQDCWQKNLLEK